MIKFTILQLPSPMYERLPNAQIRMPDRRLVGSVTKEHSVTGWEFRHTEMNSDRRFKTLIEFNSFLEKIHRDLYMPTDVSYE